MNDTKNKVKSLSIAVKELFISLPAVIRESNDYLTQLSVLLGPAEQMVNPQITVYCTKLDNFRKISLQTKIVFIYCKTISRIIERFILVNKYNWDENQLYTTAIDVFYQNPDWNMADVVCLMYYLRTNPFGYTAFKPKPNFLPSDLFVAVRHYNSIRGEEVAKMNLNKQYAQNTDSDNRIIVTQKKEELKNG